MNSYQLYLRFMKVLFPITFLTTIHLVWKSNFYMESDMSGAIYPIQSNNYTSNNSDAPADTRSDKLLNRTTRSVLVDDRVRNDTQLLHEAVDSVQNFPLASLMMKGKTPLFNESCAIFPTLLNLKFDANWQILETPNGTVYLYGAYYDNRNLTINSNNSNSPVVRILGMLDVGTENRTVYFCQLWYEKNSQPVFSPVTDIRMHWTFKNGKHRMFLLTCNAHNPFLGEVPASASLVINHCDNATNNIRIHFEKPTEKKDFAVCVKGLDYFHEDHSIRLIEWIELLHILGADKVFFHELAEHPNASKVLRYYENTDYVEVTPLTLPGNLPNDPRLRHIYLNMRRDEKRAHEMIPYNDCLYKNMYKYKYLAMLDSDEVIVPLKHLTWKEMLADMQAKHPGDFDSYSTINFQHIYFVSGWISKDLLYPEIPWYMHQLQHVHRSIYYQNKWFLNKSFHNTERTIITQNHWPTQCFEKCKTLLVDTKLAHMQHYRTDCPKNARKCLDSFENKTVIDKNLWRYKDILINRTQVILTDLGYFSD